MVNFDGVLYGDGNVSEMIHNRAFRYGDGIFETMKVSDGKILFAEDHYFRLMAGMRVLRMEIPMPLTMEYMSEQVSLLLESLHLSHARVRFSVFRKDGGFYLPDTNDVSFVVSAEAITNAGYISQQIRYDVDIYKDFHIAKHLLSTIKTSNRLINITGNIYAAENDLDDCLLINEDRNIVSALQGNVFVLTGQILKTPPLTDGCIKGIMRKQILALAKNINGLEIMEESVSPFELQKADEIFVTNVIKGIRPVTKYRKKEFGSQISDELLSELNRFVERA